MKKIKARYVWITILILFLLALALVYGCTQATGTMNTVLIVFLAIDFIAMTILIQVAGAKTFRYKPKKINYPTAEYEADPNIIKGNLKKLGYKERITPFGASYLAIYNKTALKVTIINNDEAYFNPENKDTSKPNHSLDNCTGFIGFEIFMSMNKENQEKLPDFSIQGQNVYYTAFLYDDENNCFKCFNKVEPEEQFVAGYNKLISDLDFNMKEEQKKEEV